MVVDVLPRQVKSLLRDYRDSWSSGTGTHATRARRRAAAYYYLIPTAVAAVFIPYKVELQSTTPYLSAVSVFTALLFGLLILVFNTAITLRKDGNALKNAHQLATVISDLRATITYTIVVAVLLVVALAISTAFMVHRIPPPDPDALLPTAAPALPMILPWYWTPVLVWLAVHLVLNVLKILERIRTAFNYVSR